MPVLALNERETESIREGRQVTLSQSQTLPLGEEQESRLKTTEERWNASSEANAERRPPNGSPEPERLLALADPNGQVFSVARLIGNLVQPECVIPSEALDGSL
jgi:hypothetical protein